MAKNILLVKTSSLGDVIHVLPAISDIQSLAAGERVDWVAEEPLAAVPRLHSGVARVIPVAIRRWRRALWQGEVRTEIAQCLHQIREQNYDAVIDAQGAIKERVDRIGRPRNALWPRLSQLARTACAFLPSDIQDFLATARGRKNAPAASTRTRLRSAARVQLWHQHHATAL